MSNHFEDKHEMRWFFAQRERIQAARPDSTFIWSDGDDRIEVQRGYYIFWYEQETPFHDAARVHQYVGLGDAQTQLNIAEWLNKYGKKGV